MRMQKFCGMLSTGLLLCAAGRSLAQSAARPPTTQPLQADLFQLIDNSTAPSTIFLQDVGLGRYEEAVKEWDGAAKRIYLIDATGTSETAYLGVGVEAPGDTLRAQLVLPQGAGLVVNYVDEKAPANGAVHKHDVLQKLDDQILVNAEQLMTLVRMHKPGETVSLTLIREARPLTVTVKLGAKQDDGMHVATYPLQDLVISLDAQTAPPATQPAGPAVLKDIPLVGKLLASGELKTRPITFNDGDLLACIDATGNLLAIDVKTGSMIFRGPITTEEQWKNAPQLVRDKLSAWKALIAPSGKGGEKGQDAGK